MGPAPRLATPRDPSYRTDGKAGAAVAIAYGRPWLPWQRYVADVAGERDPAGGYRYPIVVVTVPRQTGKTTWAFDLAMGRGLIHTDYRVAYTAQTGHITTERFGDRFLELAGGPMDTVARRHRSQGRERITLPGRSYVKAFPPIAGALRGSSLDLVIVDEAQEHNAITGENLDLAILPTFTTRPRRQLILIGTAGTDTSHYLRRYLTAAREGAPGYAVFEWGATAGDALEHEPTWHARHPGLGRLTDVGALRTARAAMGPAGFAREYLNVWSRTSVRIVDPADWAAIQATPDTIRAGRVCFGLEVAADRSSATIAAATDTGIVEIVERRPGTDWATGRALELAARHAAPFAVDRWGASGPVVDDLERAGADLILMRGGDVANAAAGMVDAIRTRTIAVIPSSSLAEAIDGAAPRHVADTGGFVWSRAGSVAPVEPLIAASNALWGSRHLPAVPVKPTAYAG